MEKETMSTQIRKIAKHLRKNTTKGITASKLAKLTGVPLESVYKRVYDLRALEGRRIYSNYKMVNGQRTMFYRFAA